MELLAAYTTTHAEASIGPSGIEIFVHVAPPGRALGLQLDRVELKLGYLMESPAAFSASIGPSGIEMDGQPRFEVHRAAASIGPSGIEIQWAGAASLFGWALQLDRVELKLIFGC